MDVSPGTRLGPYEILGPVGSGGMGQVYKARDTRLDRTVAIKILPPQIAADPGLRERFDREARTVASLNHPHICTLHDVGHQSGLDFLVLEFVDGETLSARLARGRMPIDAVIEAAIEMADALDRAHRSGITHRDLKPANIMLTRTGAKLLDFGLAKIRAVDAATAAGSAADTHSLTQVGALVGTIQYMAPEQLGGRPADARSDIFALGAVIYEMATGRRAFAGESQASVIGHILHTSPPPLSSIEPLASPALDHIVARCLAKDPDDRWQTARDLLLELRAHDELSRAAVEGVQARQRTPGPRWLVPLLAAGLVLAAAGLAASLLRWTEPQPLVRAMVISPESRRFNFSGDFGGPPAIAPDGRAIVFVTTDAAGRRELWRRALDEIEARPLRGTEGATFPFWAADGRAVGFFADGKLRRIDLASEAVMTVCDAPSGRGGTWNAEGTIVFTPTVRDGIYQVPASGGAPRPITRLAAAHASHRWPEFLPDGRRFVFLGIPQDPVQREETAIYIGSIDGGEPRRLVRAVTQAQVVGEDLVYLSESSLLAQRLVAAAARLDGEPLTLARNVQYDPTIWRGIFSVSPRGTFVYQAGEESGRTRLTWYDRSGRELGSVGEPSIFFDVNISPDGRRVAVNRGDPADIWVFDLDRGTGTRVTTDPANEALPIWSPDGERLVFSRHAPDGRGMLVEARADGSDSPRVVYEGEVMEASDWSPDGRFLLMKPGDIRTTPGDVWVLPLDGPRTPFAFIASSFAEFHASFAPDGRWVSYVSNESGRDEVYVTAFKAPPAGEGGDGRDPRRPGRWQVSAGGGLLPRWRQDGRELFYLAPDRRVMAAQVDGRGATFDVRSVEPLFQADPKPVGWLYDVSPDGQRLLVDTVGPDQDEPLVIVLNALLGR